MCQWNFYCLGCGCGFAIEAVWQHFNPFISFFAAPCCAKYAFRLMTLALLISIEISRRLESQEKTPFLQRVSIACYAERCISYSKSVRLSVCLSVRPYVCHTLAPSQTTQATIMRSSLEDSPMTLVSSRLTSPQNSKGNMGSEGAKWERVRKNRQFLANKSPYLRNGAR